MFSEEKMCGNGGNLAELPAPAALLLIPFIHGEGGLVAVSLFRISACSAALAFAHSLTQGGLFGGPTPEWSRGSLRLPISCLDQGIQGAKTRRICCICVT